MPDVITSEDIRKGAQAAKENGFEPYYIIEPRPFTEAEIYWAKVKPEIIAHLRRRFPHLDFKD